MATSFEKRQKERARQEKQRDKAQRKAQRRDDRPIQAAAGGIDPDIAHIIPGPQPREDDE